MRRQGNTSAIPVIDLKASSMCIQDVDVCALNHGAVIKYRLAGTYHRKALIQLVEKVFMLVQLPVGRAFCMTGDLEGGLFSLCVDVVGDQFVCRRIGHIFPEVKAELLWVNGIGVPGDVHNVTINEGKVDAVGIFCGRRIAKADSLSQKGRDCHGGDEKRQEHGV